MAAIRGDVGKIMFHNAAGTEADIAGLDHGDYQFQRIL